MTSTVELEQLEKITVQVIEAYDLYWNKDCHQIQELIQQIEAM